MKIRTRKKTQYILGYSNGTTTETVNNQQVGTAYITVNGIAESDIALRDVPETQRQGGRVHAQLAVTKSLERSLIENSELWSELAKH